MGYNAPFIFCPMLTVNALTYELMDTPILEKISLQVEEGQLLHLKGRNGAGKTTLLRLLAGLSMPTSGEIKFANRPICDDISGYQQQLCYVGHKTGLSSLLTVQENCYYDYHWQKDINFSSLLNNFVLSEYANTPCYQLSAGQQRRVALLRLCMTQAKLWLLDEPFTALDQEMIEKLAAILSHHLRRGGMVVMSSHQSLPAELKGVEYLLC